MDGSYVTTEFVALLWIALVPLRSLRVKHVSTDCEGMAVTTKYIEVPGACPQLKQVISVYAFECAIFALLMVMRTRPTASHPSNYRYMSSPWRASLSCYPLSRFC
jgi:hypothetical protein